jgi:hypothetical protein
MSQQPKSLDQRLFAFATKTRTVVICSLTFYISLIAMFACIAYDHRLISFVFLGTALISSFITIVFGGFRRI